MELRLRLCEVVGVCLQSCLCDPAVRKDVHNKRMYTGSMRITNQEFSNSYEDSNNPEFKALAKQVKSQVISLPTPQKQNISMTLVVFVV